MPLAQELEVQEPPAARTSKGDEHIEVVEESPRSEGVDVTIAPKPVAPDIDVTPARVRPSPESLLEPKPVAPAIDVTPSPMPSMRKLVYHIEPESTQPGAFALDDLVEQPEEPPTKCGRTTSELRVFPKLRAGVCHYDLTTL